VNPGEASSRAPRRRLRAALVGTLLALVAFELALQVGAFVLFHTARRDGTSAADGRATTLCVGDSFTFGLGASDPDHAYPAALQRALDVAEPGRHRVVNGGRPGRSSADVLRRLPQQLAEHRPTRVVVLAGYNDRFQRPDPVDVTALDPERAESFPVRLRTLELLQRLAAAVRGDGPGAPPPVTELHGSWLAADGQGLRVRFSPDGSCVVAGIETTFVVEGDTVSLGTDEPRIELRFARSGANLVLRGASLPGGTVEFAPEAGSTDAGLALVGRRLIEANADQPPMSLEDVLAACEEFASHPEESTLWWRTTAAAGAGVGRDAVLAAVERALGALPRTDPWRAGLWRIRALLVQPTDPDGALAAVLAAAQVDGHDETVTAFLKAHGGTEVRATFDRGVARMPSGERDLDRLEQMFARATRSEDRVADVLATHLADMARLCADAGAQLLVATYPQREPVIDRGIRRGAERASAALIDVAAAFDRALVDAAAELFVRDGHCNDRGYALVAETVSATILSSSRR
jgi:lysophospholipase L1-like esterase